MDREWGRVGQNQPEAGLDPPRSSHLPRSLSGQREAEHGLAMNFRNHDDRSDMRMRLLEEEIGRLLAAAENTEQRIALALGVHCGPRSDQRSKFEHSDTVEWRGDSGTIPTVNAQNDSCRQYPSARNSILRLISCSYWAAPSGAMLSVSGSKSGAPMPVLKRSLCADCRAEYRDGGMGKRVH